MNRLRGATAADCQSSGQRENEAHRPPQSHPHKDGARWIIRAPRRDRNHVYADTRDETKNAAADEGNDGDLQNRSVSEGLGSIR
jgi:hypothetical protein